MAEPAILSEAKDSPDVEARSSGGEAAERSGAAVEKNAMAEPAILSEAKDSPDVTVCVDG
jgi:hypothetical protein